MYCPNCGNAVKNQSVFCGYCGVRISCSVDNDSFSVDNKLIRSRERSRWPRVLLVIVIAFAALISAYLFLLRPMMEKDSVAWKKQYDMGVRYLDANEYEKAIIAFETALEIDPKSVDTYIALADVYTAQGQPEKALDVLENAQREVEDPRIVSKQREVEEDSEMTGGISTRGENENFYNDNNDREPTSTPEPDEPLASEISKSAYSPVGEVVSYNGALYYWQYTTDSFESGMLGNYSYSPEAVNHLIRREYGAEEVILESGWTLEDGTACSGAGTLAIANDRIFFMRVYPENETTVCSVNMEGGDLREYSDGEILGLSEDSSLLVVAPTSYNAETDSYSNYLVTIDTVTGEIGTFFVETNAYGARGGLFMHDGIIYQEVYNSEEERLTIYSISPDGTDSIEVYSVDTHSDLFGGNYGLGLLAEVRFPVIEGVPYIYFSYGSVAGSGGYYQGGKIARARLDGGGGEILAELDDSLSVNYDNLIGPDYIVLEDGSIQLVGRDNEANRVETEYYGGYTRYYAKNGNAFAIEQTFGTDIEVLSPEDYADITDARLGEYYEGGIITVASVDIIGNWAYVRMNIGAENGQNVGWRYGYDLVDGALFETDLVTGQAGVIYRY